MFCVRTVKRETAATPPPPPTPTKPALTEEELEKKSTAIIEEYLHINDMKVHSSHLKFFPLFTQISSFTHNHIFTL